MKFILISFLLAVAAARPDGDVKVVGIIRDDRSFGEDGSYSFDFETEDGVIRSESGSRLENVENRPIGQQGSISFTFPNGEKFELKFVADENGYQPESSWLPVAPEFPHPIPEFLIGQIDVRKAARKDAEEARDEEDK